MPSCTVPALDWALEGATLTVGGDLVAPAQLAPLWQLHPIGSAGPAPFTVLDLGELDIDDGPALARLVSWVRSVAAAQPLRIDEAPQMLAHTLYKIGGLEGGRLELRAPRMDEGTTAN